MKDEVQTVSAPYVGWAVFSMFTPILVVVGSVVCRGFLEGSVVGSLVFGAVVSLILVLGLVFGLRALVAARRGSDAKYVVRGGVGSFANGLLLLNIGVSLISSFFVGS